MAELSHRVRVLEKRNPYFSEDPRIVVFTLDPQTMAFTQVGGSPEALLGYPLADWLVPDFWPQRIHPEDRQAALAFCLNQTGAIVDHELEYRVINADGETRWVHEIVEFGSEPGSAKGYIMDITQRVAQEADVQGALTLRTQLLRVVAEELSQPVNEISGFSTMLERHLSAQHDDVGSDIAIGMRSGIEKLGAVLDQLREIALNGELDYEELSSALSRLRVDPERLVVASAGD